MGSGIPYRLPLGIPIGLTSSIDPYRVSMDYGIPYRLFGPMGSIGDPLQSTPRDPYGAWILYGPL